MVNILLSTGIERAIKKGTRPIEIGGLSESQLERAFTEKPFFLRNSAREMMQSFDFDTLAKSREIRVARVILGDIGFTGFPTRAYIFEQAPKLGLEILPAEAGPHARLQDRNQRSGDYYYIAMNPITDRSRNPSVFKVECNDDDLWLTTRWANLHDRFDPDLSFVFGLRK